MTFEGTEQLLERRRDFMSDHLADYVASGGKVGHIVDFTAVGARGYLPTLLLKTTGRRSGRELMTPLIYGCYGGEWIVVASKGGAPEHPAWLLNLTAGAQETRFQVATQAFRGEWRLVEGEERGGVWAYMAQLYPPYDDYQQAAGSRVIPLIALRAVEPVPVFEPTV